MDVAATIPIQLSQYFRGRDAEIDKINRLLADGKPGRVCITGTQGVGKTQLAVKYAQDKTEEKYSRGVFWISGNDRLSSKLAALADNLQLEGETVEQMQRIRINSYLQKNFNESEIKNLCFGLGVDFENISGDEKSAKIIGLIEYMFRRGQLNLLENAIYSERNNYTTMQRDANLDLVLNHLDLGDCLLVIDQVMTPDFLARDLTSEQKSLHKLNCHIVITSSDVTFESTGVEIVEIPPLPPAEAVKILLRDETISEEQPDYEKAAAIVTELQCLPQVVEWAATLFEANPERTLDELHAVIQENLAGLEKGDDSNHIAFMLQEQFKTLTELNPLAMELLRIASQLKEAVPLSLTQLGLFAGKRDLEPGQELLDAESVLEKISFDDSQGIGQIRIPSLVYGYLNQTMSLEEKESACVTWAQNLWGVYRDATVLAAHCRVRDLDAVLMDLVEALRFLDLVTTRDESVATLHNNLMQLFHILRLEMHNLRSWQALTNPAQFFAQQLFNQARLSGYQALEQEIERLLKWPILQLQWHAGHSSPLLDYTLYGHNSSVRLVRVTDDGQYAISGDYTGVIKVWQLQHGLQSFTFYGHWGKLITALTLTNDGQQVISGASDGKVIGWNFRKGIKAFQLAGHKKPVTAVAVTSDGQTIISSASDGTVQKGTVAQPQNSVSLTKHASKVSAMLLTSDEKWVVSADTKGVIKTRHLESEQSFSIQAHDTSIVKMVLTANGRYLITGDKNGRIKVWNATHLQRDREPILLHTFDRLHDTAITNLAAPKDNRSFISAAKSGKLNLWSSLMYGDFDRTLSEKGSLIRDMAITPDDKLLVTAHKYGTIRLWDLQQATAPTFLGKHESDAWSVTVAAQQPHLIVSSAADKNLKVWNLKRLDQIEPNLENQAHRNLVWATMMLADGKRAITAAADMSMRIWSLENGISEHISLRDLEVERPSINWNCLVVTPHPTAKDHVLAGMSDGSVINFNLETKEVVFRYELHQKPVTGVAATADGTQIITSAQDNSLCATALENGAGIHTFAGHAPDHYLSAVVMTRNSKYVIAGGHDGCIYIWELASGKLVQKLEGHAGRISSLAMARNQYLVSGSGDNSVRVWHLASATTFIILHGHNERVQDVAVSDDGHTVLSASYDCTLKLWDVETKVIKAEATLDGRLQSAALSADGRTILVGNLAGNVYCLQYNDPNQPC